MDKTWKVFEREVARFFGSTRTPLSGGNGKQTRSDTLHPVLFIECKYRKSFPIVRMYLNELKKEQYNHKIYLSYCGITAIPSYLLKDYIDNFEKYFCLVYGYPNMIMETISEAENQAEAETKIPIVCIKQKQQKGFIVFFNPIYMQEIKRELNNIQ